MCRFWLYSILGGNPLKGFLFYFRFVPPMGMIFMKEILNYLLLLLDYLKELSKINQNIKLIASLKFVKAAVHTQHTMYNPEAPINVKSNLAAQSRRRRSAQPGSGAGESPAPSDWRRQNWQFLLRCFATTLVGQGWPGTLLFSFS